MIAGRFVQGAGGAALLALSLAITCAAFPAEQQARAVGIWAAVSSLALAVGPLVGGVLIEAASWRWIFWLNLPFAALGALILIRAARETKDESGRRRLDVPGFIALSAGLIGLILALVEGPEWGWGSARTLGVLGAGLLALAAFWSIEHRARQPIIDFSLFRNREYFGASAAGFCLVGCYWCVMFFQPQYLQNVLDYSPIATGLLILPVTAPMLVISPFAGGLIARFGPRLLMTAGMLFAVAGGAVQTQISATSGYGLVLPGFLLFGIALGLVYAPMSSAAMASMPREKAGIASGVLAMNRLMAGALGLAATAALFGELQGQRLNQLLAKSVPGLSGDRDQLDSLLAGSSAAHQQLAAQPAALASQIDNTVRETFTYALSHTFWLLVGLAAVGALLTWIFVAAAPASEPHADERAHHQHHRRFHL